MKIGYPCINRSLPNGSAKSFRLASFSEERFLATVEYNLQSLKAMLSYNVEHGLLFFRISSQLIPFASHPICAIDWQKKYQQEFSDIGRFITKNSLRISMHPDQFVLINSLDEEIFHRSVTELLYHCSVLDSLDLDDTAKVQIHVGGVYGDKEASMNRFIQRYKTLPEEITRRLVIENDDRLYTVADCYRIYENTGIAVLFDNFHHSLNNNGETNREAFRLVKPSWERGSGVPLTDYSSQELGVRNGNHAQTLDHELFTSYLQEMQGEDFDVMLEIKDKEKSATLARTIISEQTAISATS